MIGSNGYDLTGLNWFELPAEYRGDSVAPMFQYFLYQLQSLVLNRNYQLKLKLIYDRQSVGQSVQVSGAHLGPLTNFSFAMRFSVDSYGFVVL
jgi:hypothetical protein